MARVFHRAAWKRFESDGKLFEDLVMVLLTREFGDYDFQRTRRTRDGGRDFFAYPLLDGQGKLVATEKASGIRRKWWAEAKSSGITERYESEDDEGKTRLSFDDVSKTMYMAYLENANKVIVFSYAPFNSEFWKYVNPVGDPLAPEVLGYSGLSLDALILKHIPLGSGDYARFFGDYTPDRAALDSIAGPIVQYSLYRGDDAANLDYGERTYSVGETVQAVLCVANETDSTIEVSFRMGDGQRTGLKCLSHFIDQEAIRLTVSAHSSRSAKLTFEVFDYKERISLPKLTWELTGRVGHGSLESRFSAPCTWLADTQLIGAGHLRCLEMFDKVSSGRGVAFFSVQGASGTGKSRILREIEKRNAARFEVVCQIDSDTAASSSRTAIRSLVSQVEALSLIEMDELPSKLMNADLIDDRSRAIASLLFDSDFDIEGNLDVIADRLLETFASRRTLVLLDNIQNFDKSFILLLDRLIDRCQGQQNVASAIAMTFNTDFVSLNNPASSLMVRLNALAVERSDQFAGCPIRDLGESEAMDYLERCLIGGNGSAEVAHDLIQTYRLIVKKWGTNPFVIKQLLICMYYDGTITRGEGSSFLVADIGAFHETLERMPRGLQALMQRRFEVVFRVAESEGVEATLVEFLATLGFMKSMPLSFYRQKFGNRTVIGLAETAGIVERNSSGYVMFTHQYLMAFFRDSDYYCEEVRYQDLADALVIGDFLSEHFDHYFVSRWEASRDSLNAADVEAAIDWVLYDNVDPDMFERYFAALMHLMGNMVGSVSSERYLDAACKMRELASEVKGLKVQAIVTTPFTRGFVSGERLFKGSDIRRVFHVMGEHLRSECTLGRQREALRLSKDISKAFEQRYGEAEDADYCRLKLLNCQTTIYYKLRDLDNGLSCADNYLAIARGIGDDEYVAKGHLIKGDVYYHCSRAGMHKTKMLDCWDKAYSTYVQSFGQDAERGLSDTTKMNVFMKGIYSDLMAGRLGGAEEKIPYIENCIDSNGMAYFEIKTRLTVAAYLICRKDVDRDSYILSLLAGAADRSVVHGNDGSYTSALCLMGAAHLMLKTGRGAAFLRDASQLAFQEAERHDRGDGWDYFQLSLLAYSRFGEADVDRGQIQVLGERGREVQRLIESPDADEDEVRRMLDEYVLIYVPDTLLALPKL